MLRIDRYLQVMESPLAGPHGVSRRMGSDESGQTTHLIWKSGPAHVTLPNVTSPSVCEVQLSWRSEIREVWAGKGRTQVDDGAIGEAEIKGLAGRHRERVDADGRALDRGLDVAQG